MSPINISRYKYTPDEMDEKAFLERFVVRNEIFEELFDDLATADWSVPGAHTIFVGQRGQGKTTLLRKIGIEVRNNSRLASFLLPVKFAEEQYQIRSLCRLWEEVADYLESHYPEYFEGLLDSMERHIEEESYDAVCFGILDKAAKAADKKLLLLVDNIDEFIGKLKEKEQRQLREILMTSPTFRIIGGSTKMMEQHFDHAKPFYEFFHIVRLKGVNAEETRRFLLAIGDKGQTEKIQHLIDTQPERIESLRRLTGGVPRTLIMLFDIFLDDGGNAFDDLMKILDESTPLYKHRMDDLPPQLQEIVHTIAMHWDGITTKEIAKKTRMKSKLISSQLKQIDKYQIIDSEQIGKNKIYKIQERFFNIWYLMRFGRKKDRQRVEWLVRFLNSWCSKEELEDKAQTFIDSLKEGNVHPSHAYHMTEALSYAGLDMETEHTLKTVARSYLNKSAPDFCRDMMESDRELVEKTISLVQENRLEEALIILQNSNKETGAILYGTACIHEELKHFEEAEAQYLKAVAAGHTDAMYNLAFLYFEQNRDKEKACALVEQSYKDGSKYANTHTLAVMLLWNEAFSKSYTHFLEWLQYENAPDSGNDVTVYLLLLMAFGQLYQAKKFLEMPEYQLKERYKPIWYALMKLMEDAFPEEIKKMGGELEESVNEILAEIEKMREKYT